MGFNISGIYREIHNPNTGPATQRRHEPYAENGGLDFINKIYKTFLKYATYRHNFLVKYFTQFLATFVTGIQLEIWHILKWM